MVEVVRQDCQERCTLAVPFERNCPNCGSSEVVAADRQAVLLSERDAWGVRLERSGRCGAVRCGPPGRPNALGAP